MLKKISHILSPIFVMIYVTRTYMTDIPYQLTPVRLDNGSEFGLIFASIKQRVYGMHVIQGMKSLSTKSFFKLLA